MKKLIMGICVLVAAGFATQTIAQTVVTTTTTRHGRVKYYYYSDANVYSNPTTGDYWYYDEPTTKWVTVKTLPSTYTVKDENRHEVWYSGENPWQNNAADMKRYKVKKNGTIKEKS
jgi:hypothetical protein